MTHPLSQNQMGIYATCMNAQAEGNYNIDKLFKLDDDIDTNRLVSALEKVIEAHPYIKSRLVMSDEGEVVLEDHTNDEFHASVIEINDIEDVRHHLGEEYDLLKDQLFRLEIYKTKNGNYLYYDFHHIIFDGFSVKIFCEDLAKAYNGEALEPEPVNGFSIAEQEKETRKSALYQEAKAWYAQEFGVASEISSMPLPDVYDEAEEHYARKWVKIDVDKVAMERICTKADVTESMLFTAAFAVTLSKFSGEEEVLYTTAFHGRSDKNTRRSLAMMVKTLPVYHNLAKTPTVVQLLQQTKQQTRAARQYSCYSFADVATDLGVSSNINFTYQGTFHNLDIVLDGKSQSGEELMTNTPGIQFLFMIMIVNGEYYVWLEYQQNKYSKEFIDGFCLAYSHILYELCTKDMLSEVTCCNADTLAILDSFNAKQVTAQSGSAVPLYSESADTIITLFQKAAKQYPDNVAAVFKDKQYTYRQLDELTDKIGALIYNKTKSLPRKGESEGVHEPVISILIPRNEYMFILPLSAMKAGCAYQPLDPSYPQKRLNFMINDADAALLLADPDLRPIINEYQGQVLLTDDLEREYCNFDSSPALSSANHPSPTPQSLLILLYTSGSTGVPKGVMLEHQNLVSFIRWYRRYYNLKPEHNVAAYASFGFDANMMDMYPALTTGATVHIIPEELRLDLVALNEYFETNNITHSFITTQVGVQFLQNADNHSLQHLSVGGEKLVCVDPAIGYTFHNVYGPTECTIFSTTFPVLKREPNIPIGKPTDNLECYVMDKHLHRLPPGAAGELIIVGKQVARGYLNRPNKTAEAFFTYNGKRAYHSGDIVRYRQDGNIEFVGRKDGQVKIRGFRIELKEVEAVIRSFPAINDVTVQAFDHPNGGKFIAAYIVSDSEVDIEALNQFILDQKPPYMVPAVTMQIPGIPLNVNQKVNRKALPKPERQPLLTDNCQPSTAAPLNVLESELKSIIASVVNTTDFTITDPLAHIGLTSISSIRLATLIYKRFGVQLNAKTLTKTGSLQSIENEILSHTLLPLPQSDILSEHSLPLRKGPACWGRSGRGREGSFPLSFAQTGVYYDIVRNPGSVSYNMPFLYTFPEGVTTGMLHKAMVAVLSAHKILGTHFEIQDTDVVQVYPENFTPSITITKAKTQDEFRALKADFVKPFNPATGPLYRAVIVDCGSNVCMLMDTLHLVMDGASVSLFLKQLADALSGIEPEAETYTYFHYALDQLQLPETAEYAASENYFTESLKTVNGVSNITEDLFHPSSAAPRAAELPVPRIAFAESIVDMQSITHLAKNLAVTPASLFLAAACYTVSRYTNTPDVCLCTISSGRTNLRISDTFGMFVNTIPVTSHVTDTTVKQYILQTATDLTTAIDHEHYPFAQIAEKFGITPTLFFQYQVGVLDDVMLKLPSTGLRSPIRCESLFSPSYTAPEAAELPMSQAPTPKFKFTISIESKPEDGAAIQIQYDATLYSQQLSQGFADAMAAVLHHFVSDINAPLKSVSMLSREQTDLIATFHQAKQADLPIQLYHKLFEHSAAQHAHHLALVALNPYTKIYETYTYAKLNEQTNRIAHSLIERGVKPSDRVAILLPRTSRLIISQYAILKAGGAYIPCDPKYPAERIRLILQDSAAKFIITTNDRLSEFPGKALDVEHLLNSQTNNTSPDVQVSPDDLAYLIYTSGSTGRPKGVQLIHKGVCNYHHHENIIQQCLKNECHAALGITTISFDMSVWETGSPLMLGKTLVLAGDDDCNDPNRLAMLINDYGIDCMTATTSRYMQLLESPVFEEAFSKHIHLAYQGGEGLSVALLRKLQSYSGKRIFNAYGPTETIANSHASELTHYHLPHIGKPCVNYTNFIIDSDGNELPVGVVGELLIGGPSVAKGYNNLPEQTISRFVQYQGQRAYKSGDYARWMPDGNVVLLGRKDNQVKLRGLRIELGEVETAITKVEGVKNVAVMIKKLAGKDHLCAYFTADRAIAIDDMKEEISKTLTHYMVPTAYRQMQEFPLTPNGKTDVKNLPEPELAKVGGKYIAPANATEADFCDIFGVILELDKVSAVDSFFDLGGSSLTATRVVIEATNKGYQISYAEVFDNPTPRKLARLMNGGTSNDSIDQEIVDYDYTAIDNLLANNNLDSFMHGGRLELGDVILTGANGYLGIHILHDLLENHIKQHPENKVYCLVRHGRNGVTSKARLRNLLFYYFENSYKDLFDTKLIVVDGDVTSDKAFEELEKTMLEINPECNTRTLINCAAIVKHFSEGTEIEDVNIGGLQKCVDFCLKTGTRLIQTSTNSSAGQLPADEVTASTALDEQHCYIRQLLKSKYTRSKFLAERIVLSAVINNGLVAKVMRLGNLSPRATDGEFQINFRSNSSMGRLHIFQMLGVCAYSIDENQMEFSPIDEVANAVLQLSQTPKECVVFHPVNNHFILLGDVVREMANALSVKIEEVEDEVFLQKLQEAGQDPEKAKILQSLLAYTSSNDTLVYIPADNKYTNRVLSRLGFHWNVTSWDYVQKFIKAIATLDFFEDKR